MEAIGAAASLLTLAKAATQAYAVATALYQGFQHAPQEITAVTTHLKLLLVVIEILRELEVQKSFSFATLADRHKELLANAIEDALNGLQDIQQACTERVVSSGGRRAYLVWTFRHRPFFGDISVRLRDIERTLTVALATIQLAMSTHAAWNQSSSLAIMQNLQQMQEQQQQQLQMPLQALQIPLHTETQPNEDADIGEIHRLPLVYNNSKKPLGWLGRYIGTELVLVSASSSTESAYRLFFRVYLPAIMRRQAFSMDFRCISSIGAWALKFDLGHMGLSNVVPFDSDIVKACKQGNMLWVKELFESNRARPTDCTPDDRPILRYAIESGCTELIKWLLQKGADATALSGSRQAGLLQGAFQYRQPRIARLLIAYGADVNHQGQDGYTPAFNLFDGSTACTEPAHEYLRILTSRDFDNINAQDNAGASALYRAAAFGVKGDVRALLDCGASPDLYTHGLHWTPIFNAVRFNNRATFEELVAHSGRDTIESTDNRGWTLLHVAADEGHFDLASRLLELGADPHAVSEPTITGVSKELRHLRLSPSDLARHRGRVEYSRWIRTLQQAGCEVEVDNDDEEFWLGQEP